MIVVAIRKLKSLAVNANIVTFLAIRDMSWYLRKRSGTIYLAYLKGCSLPEHIDKTLKGMVT